MSPQMKAEDLIATAIEAAQARGIKIVRGPVFDWCTPDDWYEKRELPYGCNATGAVLLYLGKEQLANGKFTPGWHELVEYHLGVTDFWLWRFSRGFDGGYQITLTVEDENGKEKIKKDPVSALGITMRKRFKV